MVSAKAALRSEPDSLNAQYFLALAQVSLGDTDSGFPGVGEDCGGL